MGKALVSNFILPIVISVTATATVAQGTHCSTDPSSHIDEAAADTVLHGASFVRSSGNVVPFVALSRGHILADHSAPGSNIKTIDLCIRYQIVNNSADEIIESLRWPIANVALYTYPIEAGERSLAFPVPYWAASDMFVGVNEVGAYRDAPVSVRALRPLYQTTRMPNDDASHPLGPSPAPAPNPDVPDEFEMNPDIGFSVTTPSEAGFELPSIEVNLTTPDEVPIKYRSAVSFDGEKIEFSYRFMADDARAVSTPYLAALRELFPSSSVFDAVSIANSIDNFTTELSGSEGAIEFSFFVDPRLSEFGDNSIFYTHHPISVSTETGQLCLLYPIYSPVPLRIGSDLCPEPPQ
ncbi:hypothetical protein [Phaeobacter gallaeciensis]|uniref:hypothetical protein n=1 Tax=Phaeobacter gallaeciensis TaxID=60890 RepID=UPI00237F3193|nr:hypothetical protein [Phaeobacter gallaeciensis]MDE4100299.1 hypothetical protein [Phaeobacter gallaeciensis]MDE4109103.1 hypothetical protein [Phaeobacter gallaeciensis]MDE4113570.1 hypothetical protein [Phaeobacter gallaeciensis]MDE4118038.1 hypothetical protein [Phaeobacter gallaeciensis]MDE4122517.1 hypothetical protein [Phaeobacter gallaeciensis]